MAMYMVIKYAEAVKKGQMQIYPEEGSELPTVPVRYREKVKEALINKGEGDDCNG